MRPKSVRDVTLTTLQAKTHQIFDTHNLFATKRRNRVADISVCAQCARGKLELRSSNNCATGSAQLFTAMRVSQMFSFIAACHI